MNSAAKPHTGGPLRLFVVFFMDRLGLVGGSVLFPMADRWWTGGSGVY
jgi:hypothetical protein